MSEHKEYVIINKYMPETGHGEKLTIGKWKTKQMILTSEKKKKACTGREVWLQCIMWHSEQIYSLNNVTLTIDLTKTYI